MAKFLNKYNTILTKELLEQEYIINKKSTLKIAKQINCSPGIILIYLKKWNIKIRSCLENNKGKNNPNYKKGECYELHYCIECCGNEISYMTWKYGKKRCASCAKKGIFNSHWIKGRSTEIHFCLDCNKPLSDYRHKRCKIHNNLYQRGINSPNWQGGISNLPYAFEFDSELKLKIRTRDNFVCQNCSMTEEEHLIVVGQVLTVHHIDYNKLNCKEENLITLCRSCNFRANYNREYWTKFYQEKITEEEYMGRHCLSLETRIKRLETQLEVLKAEKNKTLVVTTVSPLNNDSEAAVFLNPDGN